MNNPKITKLGKLNRITLPLSARKSLGLKAGDKLIAVQCNDFILLKKYDFPTSRKILQVVNSYLSRADRYSSDGFKILPKNKSKFNN